MGSVVTFEAPPGQTRLWEEPDPDHILSPQEQFDRLLAGRDEISLNVHRVCRHIIEGRIKPTDEQLRLLSIRLLCTGFEQYIDSTPALVRQWRHLGPYKQHPLNWPKNLHF